MRRASWRGWGTDSERPGGSGKAGGPGASDAPDLSAPSVLLRQSASCAQVTACRVDALEEAQNVLAENVLHVLTKANIVFMPFDPPDLLDPPGPFPTASLWILPAQGHPLPR